MKDIVYSTLGMVLMSGTCLSLSAQQADTLRRELRVLTSEDVVISKQHPLSVNHTAPQVRRVSIPPFKPFSLKGERLVSISPIKLLNRPPQSSLSEKQLGYIELTGGFLYNASLSAGVRPLNNDRGTLDIHFDGSYTSYRTSLAHNATERNLNLSSAYLAKLNNHNRLDISLGYRQQRHNYNGILLGSRLQTHALSLEVQLHNEHQTKKAVDYSLMPYVEFLQAQSLIPSSSIDLRPSELLIGVKGILQKPLTRLISLGGQADVYTLIGADGGSGASSFSYPSMTMFHLTPYMIFHQEGSWSAKVGADISLYNQNQKSHINLSPNATVRVGAPDKWQIQLVASGGIEPNGLSSLLAHNPYLALSKGVAPTRKVVDARLSVSGFILPELSLKGFIGHSYYINPVNFIANRSFDGLTTFLPESKLDATLSTIGGQLAYRIRNKVTLSAEIASHSWSSHMTGRPTLTGDIKLSYRPLESLEVNAHYTLHHGILQGVLEHGSTTPILYNQPTYSFFALGANYRLSSSWSFQASGHILPSSAILYYGYEPQRFSLNLGASYRF